MANSNSTIRKVVLTGGPGAGKTTAADLLRRELGEQVIIVPEAATLIFSGGFPRYHGTNALKATQSTIYHLQKNLENVQAEAFPHRTLLCDRGTLDSVAYWPESKESFYSFMETSEAHEMSRYDAVIFFETSAVSQKSVIEGGNPARIESVEEAIAIDRKLCEVWSKHQNFYHIKNQESFLKKLGQAINCIRAVIDR